MGQSEVAQFRQEQELEEASASLGLYGSAAVSRHDAINVRMQQGAAVLLQLFEEGCDEEAYALWDEGILGGES